MKKILSLLLIIHTPCIISNKEETYTSWRDNIYFASSALTALTAITIGIRYVYNVFKKHYIPLPNHIKYQEIPHISIDIYSQKQCNIIKNLFLSHNNFPLLITGPEGCGKTTLAFLIAKQLHMNIISISHEKLYNILKSKNKPGISENAADNIEHLIEYANSCQPCIILLEDIDKIENLLNKKIIYNNNNFSSIESYNASYDSIDLFNSLFTIIKNKYPQIMIIATANKQELLSPQIIIKNNFKKNITLSLPSLESRIFMIKQLLLNSLPLDNSITIEEIAFITNGFSFNDLIMLINLIEKESINQYGYYISKDVVLKSIAFVSALNNNNSMKDSSHEQKEYTPQHSQVTFNDVAGLEDAKQDLIEILDFLKNPLKYKEIGARIPHGILFDGDPGNGKTLLAKALAGEAHIPFFYASGSEFEEKYVGVGASRIRTLFKTAKEHAPCIIFIDEIDSIGKRTSNEQGNSHNQMINQLLTEMDGFKESSIPIIVVGATNLKSNIDQALLRQGRFDRHVHITFPNMQARIKILSMHAKNKPFDDSITINDIAKKTSGFSAAQLENVLNEAAIITVSRNSKKISHNDIEEAIDRITMGKKNDYMSSKINLKKTAYHEAGHTLAAILLDDFPMSLHKVTILSRGGALGVTHFFPEDDMTSQNKQQLEKRIIVSLGGRIAEELCMNNMGAGASSDFENATKIAQNMVLRYGMGEKTGVISFTQHQKISEATQREIDLEIKNIVEKAYKQCTFLLQQNKHLLKKLAEELLTKETLSADEVYKIVGIEKKIPLQF
jgi:cell division protease FtsH